MRVMSKMTPNRRSVFSLIFIVNCASKFNLFFILCDLGRPLFTNSREQESVTFVDYQQKHNS